jgi:hypothetical protein
MGGQRRFKRAGTPKPPPDAHHWMAWKQTHEPKAGVGGFGKRIRMTSPPLEDGTVPDSWPVSEFSPKHLLRTWGPGKYFIEWYAEAGNRLKMEHVEIAEPATDAGPKLRGRRHMSGTPSDDAEDGAPPLERLRKTGGTSMSVMDYLILQREDAKAAAEREERLQQRWREESAAAQQRDREFMGAIIATLKQPAVVPGQAADAEILRREIALNIREGLMTIRKDVADRLGELEPDDDERDDPDEPPADLEEAGARIGMRLLHELEQKAPDLIEEAIPRIADFLKQRGFAPSPELDAAMKARAAGVNGRPGRANPS